MIRNILLFSALVLFALCLICAGPSEAEPRIALVIGNGNYGPTLDRLSNPANDAKSVAAALRKLGFDVDLATDLDQKSMKRAIQRLGERLRAAGKNSTGFFYYAGHGLEQNGENYLIPTDAEIHVEADIDIEAVRARTVMDQMESSQSADNIIILDACRDTPFARGLGGDHGFIVQYGKAGSFIGYSTAPGHTATDGTGQNSPFAAAFASEITHPGEELNDIYIGVRRSVLRATENRQVAWDASSMTEKFYFVPPPVQTAAQTDAANAAGEKIALADTDPHPFDRATAGVATRGVAIGNPDETAVLNWIDKASRTNVVTVVANKAELHAGDKVRYLVTSHIAGFVALFSIGPDGKVHTLYPYKDDSTGTYVYADESRKIPGEEEIAPPLGNETVVAIVAKTPLFSYGRTPLCRGIPGADICSDFYQRLLRQKDKWTLVDPQTGTGDWAIGASHYVTKEW